MGEISVEKNQLVTPVFLLSLPRSGSTLLQRILASHQAVSTSPEPTFLLPLLHLDRSTDVFSTYDQQYTAMAIEDFTSSLIGGNAAYRDEVKQFARNLYHAASDSPEIRYHLDKTPKYHLVADEIFTLFEEAPIIILWRQPLAVIASIMSTWARRPGRWNLGDFRIDLYEGLNNLVALAGQNSERVISVRYEDLVEYPEETITKLFLHLDLEVDTTTLERFSEVALEGRIQDRNVSTEGFAALRADRTENWKTVLSNPVRKWWCARYLRWLGPDRLSTMGYDMTDLLEEVTEVRTSARHLLTDLLDIPFDFGMRVLEIRLFRHKYRTWRAGRPILAHK